MKRKIIALLLAAALLVSLAACGGNHSSTASTGSEVSKQSAPVSDASGDASGTNGTEPVSTDNVIMAFQFWAGAPADWEQVQAAFSERVKEELGFGVEFVISDASTFNQNMTLSLSSGETIDILNTVLLDYATKARQGYLYDLETDDLIQNYGQGIYEVVGEQYIDGCRVDGTLYGVPNNRDMATGRGCIAVATEYLEGVGYVPATDDEIVKITQEELDGLYVKIHEKFPNQEIYRPSTNSMGQFSNTDQLGNNVFGVLMDYGAEPKVEDLFSTDWYLDYCKRIYGYNQLGYISADAATDTTSLSQLVQSGKLVSYTTGGKPGIKAQESKLTGKPMTIFQTMEDFVSSSAVVYAPWTISSNTADATKAMQVLNMFYTDKELSNIFAWGIEGTHYVVKEDGQLTYPEGVDVTTSGYNHACNWVTPNQFLTGVWEDDSPDLWDRMKSFNENAEQSIAFGFSFDTNNVLTEMTAVQNVYTEYQKSIEYGMVDPEVGIPEMVTAMESAGLQIIIDEKQKQLDTFMETKK